MSGIKSLLASKTIWGALMAVAAGGLSLAGYTIAAADQVEIMNLVSGIGATGGGVLAIYGRIKATKKIA
jgi:hypothetical protein